MPFDKPANKQINKQTAYKQAKGSELIIIFSEFCAIFRKWPEFSELLTVNL